MSISGNPDDPDEVLGEQQDSEIVPQAPDPREPYTKTGDDQDFEIDPEAPAPR